MNRRVVSAMTLGLALTGCVQGRSAPPGAGGARSVATEPVPAIQDAINAGLPGVSGRTAPPTGSTAGTSAWPAAPDRSAPVGMTSLPPLSQTINAGPTPLEEALRRALPGEDAPAAEPGTAPAEKMASRDQARNSDQPHDDAVTPSSLPATTAGGPSTPPASPADAGPAAAPNSPGQIIGLSVATVDGESITLAELRAAVEEYRRDYLPDDRPLSSEELDGLASMMLQQLIDRTLLIQEARRRLINTEQKQAMFDQFASKQWQEQEIPKLLRKHKAENEIELRKTLESQGRSLEMMRESFRRSALAREYLHSQMQSRVSRPEKPQLLAYYREHLAEFQRPARVTWREIVVKPGDDGDRAAARRQAEALHEQARRGADFAALARASSQGPTAARGGLWETEPGASVVPAINDALDRLPLNQLSPVLEGPQGFHIVRVEGRRPAGPRPFEEAQGDITLKLQEEGFRREVDAFIQGLRDRAIIISRFDGTPSAPAAMRDAETRRTAAAGP